MQSHMFEISIPYIALANLQQQIQLLVKNSYEGKCFQ